MTIAELDPLFLKYRNKGLLLDANLLYLVGELDAKLVPNFKRTRTFTVEDFLRLKAVVDFFPTVGTIPGVLTEVNSLAGHLDGNRQTAVRTLFERKSVSCKKITSHRRKRSVPQHSSGLV